MRKAVLWVMVSLGTRALGNEAPSRAESERERTQLAAVAVRPASPPSASLVEPEYAGTYVYAGSKTERAAVKLAVDRATAVRGRCAPPARSNRRRERFDGVQAAGGREHAAGHPGEQEPETAQAGRVHADLPPAAGRPLTYARNNGRAADTHRSPCSSATSGPGRQARPSRRGRILDQLQPGLPLRIAVETVAHPADTKERARGCAGCGPLVLEVPPNALPRRRSPPRPPPPLGALGPAPHPRVPGCGSAPRP